MKLTGNRVNSNKDELLIENSGDFVYDKIRKEFIGKM